MYLHTDDGPSDYPLALGTFAESSQPVSISTSVWSRLQDLKDFGLVSATEDIVIQKLIKGGETDRALAIITEKENKAATRMPKKQGWMNQIDNIFPTGYKLNDHLITSVPNYVLYGGALVGMIFLRSAMKRKG